ncbi:hypothetical protein JI435_022810, partial [Parastagonospora nodorum SN15]
RIFNPYLLSIMSLFELTHERSMKASAFFEFVVYIQICIVCE